MILSEDKLKHFDFEKCINFWDDFNFELYVEVLKAKATKKIGKQIISIKKANEK